MEILKKILKHRHSSYFLVLCLSIFQIFNSLNYPQLCVLSENNKTLSLRLMKNLLIFVVVFTYEKNLFFSLNFFFP